MHENVYINCFSKFFYNIFSHLDYLKEKSGQVSEDSQDDLSEDEKIALLGKPRLGEQYKVQIRIKESREFKVRHIPDTFCNENIKSHS